MISTINYVGDGNSRVFPVSFEIMGEDYVVIFLNNVAVVDRTHYDIINNSIVFVDGQAPATGTAVDIVVATDPTEIGNLNAPPSNVQTVLDNLTNINAVAANRTNIDTVASNTTNVTTVSNNIVNINSVATNIVPNLAEILQADTNATLATTKASEASASATSAAASATTASSSETIATTKAAEALASANNAATQAGIAATYASNALTSENNAITAAQAAGVSADEVGTWTIASPFSVATIGDLSTIDTNKYTTSIVKDIDRGGIFIWSATGVSNSGTVFAGTTGFWHRYYYGAVNVKWFGAKGNGVNDDRQAIQNTIDYLVSTSGGGEIYIPKGSYLIGSIVSPDTIRNGLLIAGTTEYSTNNSIRLIGEGNESVLLAKDNDMCIIRNARVYSNIENIKIDGNGKTNVIGVGILAENIASTTILTSNSYFKMNNAYIENCTTGMIIKPGATVGGSASGCFYHSVNNVVFNLNTEHLKLEKDTAGYNRVTRSVFSNCTFTRGNAGVNILGGTELNFINCNYELINGTAFYYGDTNPANISIFGGYAEGCTKGLSALNTSAPYINVYGYQEAMSHDISYAFMNINNGDGINISKLPNSSINLNFGNSAFASIIADIDRTNSKTLSFTTNDTEAFRINQYNRLLVGTKVDDGLNSKLQVVGTISHKGDQVNLTSDSTTYEIVNRGSIAKEFQWYVGAGGSTPIAKLTTAGTWTNASDIRIKKDIKDIKYGLDTVLSLSPKSYKLKQDDSEKIGFIAQEIKDIVPEVVYGKDDDFLTLDYASMVSILVKAVQEQQQQINLLKQKIGE